MDDIHRDPPLADITGQSFGETNESGLAHRVQRDARDRHAIGVAGADGDDAAAVLHPPGRGLRGDEDTADVEVERAVELVPRDVPDRAVGVDAGVGHEHVEAPELVRGALDGDGGALRGAAERLGLVAPGPGGEALVRAVSRLYVPFAADRVEAFPRVLSPEALRAAGTSLGALRREVRVPGELPFLNRTVVGLDSVLARLDASAAWHRIASEYACGAAPSTALGEAERAWRATSTDRETPGRRQA